LRFITRTRTAENTFPKRVGAVVAAVSFAVGLASCTIQLAPSYDAGIVNGLNQANAQAETLFVTVQSGVTKDTFASRQPQYDAVIGQFSALSVQISARAMPQPPSFLGGKLLPPSDVSQIPLLKEAPSKGAVDQIVKTLTDMRNDDQSAGSAKTDCSSDPKPPVCLSKGIYELNFKSALTYETALQR